MSTIRLTVTVELAVTDLADYGVTTLAEAVETIRRQATEEGLLYELLELGEVKSINAEGIEEVSK